MDVVDLVLGTHRQLVDAGIAHAFGGALALAYYAEPRATLDADVNIFLPLEAAPGVVERFAVLDLHPDEPPESWAPISGVRLVPRTGVARLDLFFDVDERYDEIQGRVRWFPFGANAAPLPFLSAEDLMVFKLSFGRDKDWTDLRSMAETGTEVDLAVVEDLLIGLRGPSMYPRLARARALFDPG